MQLEQIIADLQNLIIKKPTDRIYIERIKKVNAGIKIFEIKSIGYK